MNAKKIAITSAVSALVILGIGFMVIKVNAGPHIPKEFFQERIQGAGAAKNLARMVSDSLANLVKIEALDKEGNITQAINLVAYEREINKEKQAAAVLLASNLQKMAEFTKAITPIEARQASVEAVTSGVALVSNVITYNSYLDGLFEALSAKFARLPYSGRSVKDLIANINAEARTINDLSQRFNALLADFDAQFVK